MTAGIEPVWLSKPVLLRTHWRLIEEHGGSHGLRDEGLLDSALARPQQLFAYGAPDVAELATAYAGGIVRNHPFIDGNKRTAFMAAYIFLARNGLQPRMPEPEAVAAMVDLAAGTLSEADFAAWLRNNCAAVAQ